MIKIFVKIILIFALTSDGIVSSSHSLNSKIIERDVFSLESEPSSSGVIINYVDSKGYFWPGSYTFKLRSNSGESIWSKSTSSFMMIFEAPFWRTRIAYFTYVFIILFLFYLILQLKTSALRKSNRILRENEFVAKEVSRQKDLLSYRNKNIEDSLHYAQRIQKAILVTPEDFKKILPKSFIMHLPKDIVSGDFYWISEKGNKVFVAAVDCTGHGVPGAFMSLIGLELFRKITSIPEIEDAGIILNYLNDNIQEIFGKGGNISLSDGMDLAFCIIDKEELTLEFAGAINPLYLIRDDKLIEIKGDRFSISADIEFFDVDMKKFSSHKLKLQKDDMFYIFSDGFADQFGGPAGNKYKYRRFRHLLLTVHKLDLERQKYYLEENIEDWKGNEEQVDDILVIGIKADFQTE
ncbi:MAG: SpoIIE family protein phosphatase [Bacteroidales bacterium]|nr:SpoIIE family protein phosphatase [Bacteroidales bacterium]